MNSDLQVETFRFGAFEFSPATGELRRFEANVEAETTRLQPQPAKLLEVLLDKGGELVTREGIQSILWPESYVESDQGLNFCISQVRAALGDVAADPTYIETLPRRGYRMLIKVERVMNASGAEPRRSASGELSSAKPRRLNLIIGIVGCALLAVILWVRFGGAAGAVSLEPIRLAIMPFELSATEDFSQQNLARISEWLVAEMSTEWDRPIAVLGPRSTAGFSQFPFPEISRMESELEIDFVLNARALEKDGSAHLIVELIRIDDGDHVWVKYFTSFEPWSEVAQVIRDGVAKALQLQQ